MITLFHTSLLLSFGLFILPKKWMYGATLLLQTLFIFSTSIWAVQAMMSVEALIIPLGISTWSGEIILSIDKLSAFFILIIDFICLAGIIYAGGYLQPYIEKKRSVIISLHLFSFIWLNAAMVMVTAIQDGLGFLLAWELMSLTSFILVIFEGQIETTLKTGINYLLQMHFGFALIMFGFLIVNEATGEMSFGALNSYFAQHSNTIVFLTFFAGFGIKAGFMPLHTWLPKAHPAAPSHVSGVMSGVMIKMGIYGILRVTSFLQGDLKLIGTIVLVVGIVSGLVGVILAIAQHDLKRLLAYHSVENIGIIGIGIGISILGLATHDETLAVLGMAGALLHCLNHALFKSLLFFSAGNIFYATHTVNMDQLGGIVNQSRLTSIAFLVGAIAISGIPPFNGFISEFLIYSGVAHNFTHAGFGMSLAGLAAFVSLVLIGGLCIYCFTKAFGLTFLGSRRSFKLEPFRPVPWIMIAPLAMLVTAILSIGFFPAFFLTPITGALSAFGNLNHDPGIVSQTNGAFKAIGFVNVGLVACIALVYLVRVWQQRGVTVITGPTWGCGYSAGDFRHQYTPTSYADSLIGLAGPAVIFNREYRDMGEAEVFPGSRTFHTHADDRLEHSTVTKIIGLLVRYLPLAGRAQTGFIHHYLIYPVLFMVTIALLTYLNFI
ncbi:MAG: proton-conducting transporter membrane subunit [Cytophagales bacterium]|nr:proton-conducting transporter membrane subunit [Cytophagales bacterium]